MSEGRRLIQIGKKELLEWGSSLLDEKLSWKSFSDGSVLLKFCFIVWPSLNNTRAEINALSDSWRKIEAIFRTLSIDYSKLIDEDGIKNDKLCSAYNSVIIFFFLYHCAFKNESSFEFIPPPSKQVADFLMGDSSIKSLIVGGSLQLSPKTQIRLFENDSKAANRPGGPSAEGVRFFKGDEGAHYDRIQRFNETMEMDERAIKLIQSLDTFFESLNEKMPDTRTADLPEGIDDFTSKVRQALEYCVRQMVRTKEEQAIERANFESRIKTIEEDCEKKIEQLKLTYEEKIREIENEGKQKLIQEKKASQMMLRTMQNNQTLNMQMSDSIYKEYQDGDVSLEELSTKLKNKALEQLKCLQEIVNEENKKRDEIERTLNEEITSYQKENKRLRYTIYRYVVDVSSSTPQFDRVREISDQLIKIYAMAETWWSRIVDSREDVVSERSDLNYKMERMRMDEVLGYLKHILDKYQEYPKGLNKVGLSQQSAKTSSFEFEMLVQNNHLVNDCLKIVCDLVSESLLKTNRINQLKDIILSSGSKGPDSNHPDSEENQCYCGSDDLFGSVYGRIVCSDEKKHLKEKVQHLNHEKLLLQRGIEFLKKKLYTLKNQQLIVSSENNESNLDLMASIDKPLGETEISSQEIIQVSDLWDISNYLKEDGVNDLAIMSEFLVIINRWKRLFKQASAEGSGVSEFRSQNGDSNLSREGVMMKGFNFVPFVTSSSKLIEVALESEFSQSEFFEQVKRLESQEFDLEGDFEKELEMISKIASVRGNKDFEGDEGGSEAETVASAKSFPSSLIKVESMFWRLVICLHILRDEYRLLQIHKGELESKLQAVLEVMEDERRRYEESVQEMWQSYVQSLRDEKSEHQIRMGKLRAQLILSKVEKHALVNKPGKFTVSVESKEKLSVVRRVLESLSAGLEVSNAFRFVYQVSDELWNALFEALGDQIKGSRMEDKVCEISDQLKGLRQYLKQYSESQSSTMRESSAVEEREDISEYISSKLMEIGDNSELGLNVHQRITSFLKDLALKNSIPLDWLQFLEMLVSARTIELSNEIDLLRQRIKDQEEVILGLKHECVEVGRLNSEKESELEINVLERRGLEERLEMVGRELEMYKSNNELLKDKFKEADEYYTNQLLLCNKRLNCLEKMCLLSMDYGVKIQHFRDFYNSKMEG